MPFSEVVAFAVPSVGLPEIHKLLAKTLCTFFFYPLKVKYTLNFQFMVFFFNCKCGWKEKKKPIKADGAQVQKKKIKKEFLLIVCMVRRVAEGKLEGC